MLRIRKEDLYWDTINTTHILKHDVVREEVEITLKDSKIKYIPGHTSRFLALGRSKKRLLSIVINKQRDGKYYVVSARDMSKRERKIYRGEII